MKSAYLLFVLLAGVAIVTAVPIQEVEELSVEKGWYVPHANGSFYWVSVEEAELMKKNSASGRAKTIKLYLYTWKNPTVPQQIDPSNAESLRASNFNASDPTRMIIHGWQNNHLDPVNTLLTKAYLSTGRYNVFCVDWSANSETINYPSSSYKVKGVGKQLAAFIDLNNEHNGLSFETLELNGHSLGAHCAGHAGKRVKRGRIHTIRGMDTASPLFTYSHLSERLTENDAYYVESIHTNGGKLGFLEPIGKASFYPNGGESQPGCGLDITGSCSHSRSYEYLAEAITYNSFPSLKCPTYKSAVKKKCGKNYSSDKLGSPSNEDRAMGTFYTPIHKRSPFGMGL